MDELDGMLGKAEAYFGRTVTAWGLAIIGLGAVSAAVRAIWKNMAEPVWTVFARTGLTAELAWNIAQIMMGVGFVFLVSSDLLRARKERIALKETRELLDRAREVNDESDQTHERLQAVTKEADEKLATAQLLMEAATTILRDQGTIGQERADSILSLLNTVEERLQ